MPASEVRILSTRPLGAALLKQAAEKGITIDTLSFIATDPILDDMLTRRVQDLRLRPLQVVFTSMNAVEAVVNHLSQQRSGDAMVGPAGDPAMADWKIFCIGAATRQLVESHFGVTAIAGTAPSASELADVILRQPPSEVFFFCGDQRRDELPDELAAAGVKVHEYIVYRTLQTPHKIEARYDGIAFFSPSAVHSFFSVNMLPETTTCFAIGSTTAETIRTYGDNLVIISGSPEKEALVRQIIDYFQNNI